MSKSINSMLVYLRKERSGFARYASAHPHIKRNILLDALISTVVVIVGFGFVNGFGGGARADELMRSGGVVLSSDELAQHVKSQGIAAYWFGPIEGYKYTIICTNRNEIIITYLPQGVSVNHPDRYNLTIETYASNLVREQKNFSNASSDKDDFLASNGTFGTTDLSYPQRVQFSIANSGKIVEVQYPSVRRLGDLHVDAQRLQLISGPKS
jgi:hypothetical protein